MVKNNSNKRPQLIMVSKIKKFGTSYHIILQKDQVERQGLAGKTVRFEIYLINKGEKKERGKHG